MPSGKDFVNRLKEEFHRTLSQHFAPLEKELESIKSRVSSSLEQVEQKLGPIEIPAVETILLQAMTEAAQERAQETTFLAHFGHDVRQKETQEEILTLLLDGAHRYAPRVALFLMRGDRFVGWASRGFSEIVAQQISHSAFPRSASTLLQGSLNADGLNLTNDPSNEDTLLQLFRDEAPPPWHAFPLKVIQRPVAVLLAGPETGRDCDLESLYIIMDLAGLRIENLALKILQEMRAYAPAAPGVSPTPPVDVGPQPSLDRSTPVVSAGEALATSTALASPDEQSLPVSEAAKPDLYLEMESIGEQEEVMPSQETTAPSRFAGAASSTFAASAFGHIVQEDEQVKEAHELEGIPLEIIDDLQESISSTAPVPEQGKTPQSSVQQAESGKLPRPWEIEIDFADEEKLHSDAKRFARLLVSEIKLYNEKSVVEGRVNRDIYARLKRDIDRSREMYQKRVSPVVTRKIDYFHHELIRILGDNDPSSFGNDYPGPRVES